MTEVWVITTLEKYPKQRTLIYLIDAPLPSRLLYNVFFRVSVIFAFVREWIFIMVIFAI